MLSNMNMNGNYSLGTPVSVAPDDKIKLEIIKLSNMIESSMYPCVYFCNLYGHSFHLTNGKMKRYIRTENDPQISIPGYGGNGTAGNSNSSSSSSSTTGTAGANTTTTTNNNNNAAQGKDQPSPFKRMIDSIFHCGEKKKNEISGTFMSNALIKSNEVVKKYFDDAPAIPSYETTFTYDSIPILDYQTKSLLQTTLLVNLSRTVNGEMFIHKVHFTNIKRRVIEMPAGFTSTNRIAYNSAPNLQPLISAMARNIRNRTTTLNKSNNVKAVRAVNILHEEAKSPTAASNNVIQQVIPSVQMPANANSVANGGDINKPAAPGRNINDDDLVPSTRMDSTDMLDNANSSLSTNNESKETSGKDDEIIGNDAKFVYRLKELQKESTHSTQKTVHNVY